MNNVEGIHHRHRPWKLAGCCAFVAAEPIHRHDLDVVLPLLGARGQPGRQDACGAALHHVQEAGRASMVAYRGQVHDHRGVLVPTPMTPHVLINPNDAHAFKASRIRQQEFFPVGQYRLVGGMPGYRQVSGDPIHGHIVSDQAHKPPAQGPKGEFGAWGSRLADVVTPGARTRATVVTSHIHRQRCGLMPPRFVR